MSAKTLNKVIARIKGGLGNQLFCYAAARRFALVNNAELVIDDVTGFVRDQRYRSTYLLDRFHLKARKATASERFEPFERYRRGMIKAISNLKPFNRRRYLTQEGVDFDPRLLSAKVEGSVYLDGLWQSEGYFKDVEGVIRKDLELVPPEDALNIHIAKQIACSESVAIHVRWFDSAESMTVYNASADYYRRAVDRIEGEFRMPQYFIFSDNPEAARAKLSIPDGRAVFVAHNVGRENAFADLWLMAQCRNFITANSTFSWWGAWLGAAEGKVVVTPDLKIDGKTAWGFKGLIPSDWIAL